MIHFSQLTRMTDSCIKMGSDERHFKSQDSVHKPQPFWRERRAEAESNRGRRPGDGEVIMGIKARAGQDWGEGRRCISRVAGFARLDVRPGGVSHSGSHWLRCSHRTPQRNWLTAKAAGTVWVRGGILTRLFPTVVLNERKINNLLFETLRMSCRGGRCRVHGIRTVCRSRKTSTVLPFRPLGLKFLSGYCLIWHAGIMTFEWGLWFRNLLPVQWKRKDALTTVRVVNKLNLCISWKRPKRESFFSTVLIKKIIRN